MRFFTKLTFAALLACAFGTANSAAQSLMPEATLDYPSGYYASFAPSSISITWNNQEIMFINPDYDEFGDEYVTAYATLGDAEPQPVNAYIMSSFGNPEDPDDQDFWFVEIALYELDDLWTFDGTTVTVSIPEGVVENLQGELNPAQDFVFHLMPTFTDYQISPESGSTISDKLVKVSFGGNPLEYLQSDIRVMSYEPTYRDITLNLGDQVTINDNNEIEINLSSFEDGYYEIVIPEGFVTVDVNGEPQLSAELWLEYTLQNEDNAVEIIPADNGLFTVYTLDGTLLLQTPSLSTVSNLPSGLYIVNGKKLLIP